MPTPPLADLDAKQVAVDLLDAALTGVLVTGSLPEGAALTAALPAVRVLRLGGVRDIGSWGGPSARDNARFSVDCYADSPGAAMRLALRVLDAWEALPNQHTADGLVTGVSQETGPQDRPEEPNSTLARVGMTLGMSVRPPLPTS
ncbi:hypothetical protein [Streptomyces sp. NPDC047097]|uniref:hypothetical protein n=1 Tax=Streptomyces sp. NPDC047097 TaxID=3155260 RepID=UPI0033ECF62E